MLQPTPQKVAVSDLAT